ncbi:UNVERIFIED_CONTAM: hypothetical protein Sradi_2341000 [Sesamum radiatum]|uniref:Uncharacterized protein n=1 Tax=Sesamum radiatum TaxID=300843 RepID=A0AAW2T5T4_SESRA
METLPLDSEEDLDHLLGEAEAELRRVAVRIEGGTIEEKVSGEELSQLVMEDVAGPSNESQAQEESAEVGEKAPSVGRLIFNE